MEIKFLQKIKAFLERRKLKKLSDETLAKKVEEKIKNEKIEEIPNIVGNMGDDEKQLEMAKNLVESEQINMDTKKDIINTLPHETKRELFKKSVQTKEILAKKDLPAFIEILVKDKKLKPYDELYYRVDKAFSDSELAYIMQKIQETRPEDYDEEKILRVIAKQILVDNVRYGTFLPSHLGELTSNIIIANKDSEESQRKFDILVEEDRKKLFNALEEEADILNDAIKDDKKEKRIGNENLKIQMNNMVQFAEKRKEEIQTQSTEK